MDLTKLFEMQCKLDERIIKEKELEGQDLFKVMHHALRVEIAEAENAWQGFKVWKVNPEPKETLLVELVDILHFILSQGLRKGYNNHKYHVETYKFDDILDQFEAMYKVEKDFYLSPNYGSWGLMMDAYYWLITNLGFTWEQIEQAYMDKNKVNHERQNNGY